MAEDRTKLPDNLFVDTNYCQISYLESLVGNKLMIFDIPNEDAGKADGAIAKLTKHIPKGNSCQIVEAPADLKLATPENIVILKFLNRSDLLSTSRSLPSAKDPRYLVLVSSPSSCTHAMARLI